MRLQDLVVSRDCQSCVAICYDDGVRKVFVTYSDLLQSSTELTCDLMKHVGDGKLVALYAPPSVDLFVAILGILRVPAAYVPVALNQLDGDKVKLVEQLQINMMIVHRALHQEFLNLPWHSVAITVTHKSSCGDLYVYSLSSCPGRVLAQSTRLDLAYVMSTSGTTGLPKFVRVPHCCVVPNIIDLRQRFNISSDDIVFNAAPYTFDPSVVEMFLAFSSGATLLVVPEVVKASPTQLATVLLNRNYPTVVQATPSLVCSLGNNMICTTLLGPQSSLQVLAFGGEACPSTATIARWKHVNNNTRIFNIYGITEVSSWASCYEILRVKLQEYDELVLNIDDNYTWSSSMVPLGDPLLDTCVQLRDEHGSVVTSGHGEIWIGGQCRVCLLGNEEEVFPGTMRPTGDHGCYRSDGQLYYIGRTDKQIKRLGHRINLDHIQQVISSMLLIKTCVVSLFPGHTTLQNTSNATLILFAVPDLQHYDDRNNVLQELHSKMRQLLPSYCIPDSVILMDTLPMTSHGKVDVSLLLKYAANKDKSQCSQFTCVEMVEGWITSLAKLVGVECWKSDANFLQSGGDSFQLVQIINLIDDSYKVSNVLGEVMETALNKSLHDTAVCLFEHFKERQIASQPKEADIIDNTTALTAKRPKLSTTKAINHFSLRKGHFYVNNKVMLPRLYTTFEATSSITLTLEVCWTIDTQKCVDSSPLLVSSEGDETTWVAYIGSHSGIFFAIDVTSGDTLWQVLLTDRIMSSAVLSDCGKYVVVGCYDGYLYVLDVSSGAVHWTLSVSNQPIKSSPSVDTSTALVWFGSHDHNLYSVDVECKQVVHKIPINGGIIASSPLIDDQQRQLYISTLSGHVVAVNCDSQCIVWRHKCPKPVFASPSLLHDHSIVVGCVNGELVKLTHDGKVVQKLSSQKSIFESPCPYKFYTSYTTAYKDDVDTVNMKCSNGTLKVDPVRKSGSFSHNLFLFGDHDCNLITATAEMCFNWKVKLDSAVGSSPFVGNLNLPQGQLAISCCCTVNGNVYIVDLATGKILTTTKLPGEIFSSPLIIGDKIILGCRDNNVYCLRVHANYNTCIVK